MLIEPTRFGKKWPFFNFFVFTSSNHFPCLIKSNWDLKKKKKIHENFNKLFSLCNPIFRKSIFEITVVLFFMKCPKCREKMKTFSKRILHAFGQPFIYLSFSSLKYGYLRNEKCFDSTNGVLNTYSINWVGHVQPHYDYQKQSPEVFCKKRCS